MKDGKHVILQVDDDPDFRESLRVILESADYEVVDAESAEEGLRKYKAANPDFIMVDLMMEEIDSGTSLVKELKLAGNKAPVYMLSSAGDQLSLATDYSQLGLDGVLQKPINPDKLLRTIKEKLAQKA